MESNVDCRCREGDELRDLIAEQEYIELTLTSPQQLQPAIRCSTCNDIKFVNEPDTYICSPCPTCNEQQGCDERR